MQTPKRMAEVRAGRRLTEAFGTIPPGVEPPTSADSINVANTSVLPLQGEVLALWEGGSATRIDARTLATLGLKTWRPDPTQPPLSPVDEALRPYLGKGADEIRFFEYGGVLRRP